MRRAPVRGVLFRDEAAPTMQGGSSFRWWVLSRGFRVVHLGAFAGAFFSRRGLEPAILLLDDAG